MKKKTLYVVTLELIEQRYTKQWHNYWEKDFSKYFNVKYIDGPGCIDDKIDKGKFLDINKTCHWKAQQIIEISELFQFNKIQPNDTFIFMDGWHFGITALKYMSQLNNIPVKIYAYWHAGTWDDNDFITQAGLRDWARFNEIGWFFACDGHFVATQHHKDMIVNYFWESDLEFTKDKDYQFAKKYFINSIHVVGFPMDWEKEINSIISKKKVEKENIIVFPHRLDKEKCPEVFDELAKLMPEYKFIKTLEVTKTKKEYYDLLRKAKIIFSASEQETFGIGTVEALCLGCIPIVPNKGVYMELYDACFRYVNIDSAKHMINHYIKGYNKDMTTKRLNNNRMKGERGLHI